MWSIKTMHRLIMSSRAYQLASTDDDTNLKLDADNVHHWRYPRRRLDAESIRDALLSVSGRLDRTPAGDVVYEVEPGTSFGQRMLIEILETLPIEWLL